MRHGKIITARLPKGVKLRLSDLSERNGGELKSQRSFPTDTVFGVVYKIPLKEKAALDRAEGLGRGYNEQSLTVRSPDGRELSVLAYIADPGAVDDDLRPYSWYKDFVLRGAAEHRLPFEYLESRIRSVPAIVDPDKERERARRSTTRLEWRRLIRTPTV